MHFLSTIGGKFGPLIDLRDKDMDTNTLIAACNTAVTDAASEILWKECHTKKPLLASSVIGGGRVVQWSWVNFQCWGVLLIWIRVGHGPTALAVDADGGYVDIFLSSIISLFFLSLSWRGWSGGAMVLGKLPVPGRPTSLDKCRARAYCSCSRCGWGLCGHFYSHYPFSSFSLSLGDGPT